MKSNDLLAELLIEWESGYVQGREPSAAELAGHDPALAEQLQARIQALKATRWMDRFPSSGEGFHTKFRDFAGKSIHDRYLIEQLLGRGGHASVWAAVDLKLGRRVAVKIPHTLQTSARLQAEGRRIAQLKHPHILPVFDCGTWENLDYIVTEIADGVSLAETLKKERLSFARIRQIVTDVAEGLDHAHAHQIIHLDVKPSNILLEKNGRARLCDFGVAASMESSLQGISGTLQFMAPEQVTGQRVSPQTDIYALGVLVHLLVSGKLPYQTDKPVALRNAIANGSIHLADELPAQIRKICQRAMALDPGQRYAKACDLGRDLKVRNRSLLQGPLVLTGLLLGPYLACHNFTPAAPLLSPEWIHQTRNMQVEDQIKSVQAELKRRNPSLIDPGKALVQDGKVIAYELITDHVSDISPLRGFQEVEKLTLAGSRTSKPNGRLTDLRPLDGMKIKWLSVTFNRRLKDLTPLSGLPLEFLNCGECDVEDLSPLGKCPLKVLVCGFNPIADLSPLRGLTLEELHCNSTQVRDLSPVAGMPLKEVRCQDSPVGSLEPLRGAPLGLLECHRTNITDISPLAGNGQMWGLNIYATKVPDKSPLVTLRKLRLLALSYDPARDQGILSRMESLEEINSQPAKVFLQKNEVGPALLR